MTCVSRCGITGGRPSTELTSTRTTCTAMLTASAIQVQVRPRVRPVGLRGACKRSTAHLLHDAAEPMNGFGKPRRTDRQCDAEVAFTRGTEGAAGKYDDARRFERAPCEQC